MSLPYVIDFTDPLKGSFSIPQAGFNGPGGTSANTTLRLYGRGALEWGESVDEDLVRLLENFSGGSEPIHPTDGQIWREVKLYWHNTTAGTHAGWYVYNNTTHVWALLNGTGAVATSAASPAIGNYYYDSALSKLFLYDSRYKQEPAGWFERSFRAATVVPGSTIPQTAIRIYSEGTQQWMYLNPSVVRNTAPITANVERGNLWYDTTVGSLKVWNGTVWVVATPGAQTYPLANSTDVASIAYVNGAILAATTGGSDVGQITALGNGIVVKTGVATYAARTLAAGTGITITNPAGTAGNPSIAVDTSVIATQAYVLGAVGSGGTVTVEPISAGVPSNATGVNGDIRYQY